VKPLGLILALAVTLSACVMPGARGDEAETGLGARVERSSPTVLIQPQNAPVRPFKVAVLPFGVRTGAASPLSKELTEAFAHAWAGEHAFAAVYYEPDQENLTHEQAILVARDRGADCVALGRLGGIQDAGDDGACSAGLSFEIFDVNSGACIWSMTISGHMSPDDDFSLFKQAGDAPEHCVRTVVTALAHDTGAIIKKWNSGMAYSTPGAASAPVSVPALETPPPPPKKPLQSSDLSS